MAQSKKMRKPQEGIRVAIELAEHAHYKNCPPAEISTRFSAFLLDSILTYLATTGIDHVANALTVYLSHLGDLSWLSFLSAQRLQWISQYAPTLCAQMAVLGKLAFLYFYFVWSLVFSGGTPGKLLLGIRVLEEKTGRNLSLGQALLRQCVGLGISFLSFGFGLAIAIYRPDHKALHDMLAGSVVKKVHGAR